MTIDGFEDIILYSNQSCFDSYCSSFNLFEHKYSQSCVAATFSVALDTSMRFDTGLKSWHQPLQKIFIPVFSLCYFQEMDCWLDWEWKGRLFILTNGQKRIVMAGADLGGGCRGCAPPPPWILLQPWIYSRFSPLPWWRIRNSESSFNYK